MDNKDKIGKALIKAGELKVKSYDGENDLLFVRFEDSKDYQESEEFRSGFGQDFVIDYDSKGRIIGIEVFEFKEFNEKFICPECQRTLIYSKDTTKLICSCGFSKKSKDG